MSSHVRVEADLRTLDDVIYISPRTVVSIPPSTADALSDEMRVAINGAFISRAFDPGLPIVTGGPIPYVTKAGEGYVTKGAEAYVTKVQP